MTSFKPIFDRREALALAEAYDSGGDEPALRARQAIASGDFSRVHPRTIFKWKTEDSGKSRIAKNCGLEITNKLMATISPQRQSFAIQSDVALLLIVIVVSITCTTRCTATPPVKRAEPMVFKLWETGGNCNDCGWVSADGIIAASTPDDFEKFVHKELPNSLPGVKIYFNSVGGNLLSGLQLGEMLRQRKWSTGVARSTVKSVVVGHLPPMRSFTREKGECASACAYAFLGGVTREAKAGDLGFHQFYSEGTVSKSVSNGAINSSVASTQQIMGLLVVYLKEMGVAPELLFLASNTSPSALFVPDETALFALNIANISVVARAEGWKILPFGDGAIVRSAVNGGPNKDGRQAETASFYCEVEHKDRVFVELGWQYPTASSASAGLEDNNIKTAIESTSIIIKDSVVRADDRYNGIVGAFVDKDDTYHLTFSMSVNEFVYALRSGGLEYKVEAPHYLGYFGFDFFIPMTIDLAKLARIAFNSCS